MNADSTKEKGDESNEDPVVLFGLRLRIGTPIDRWRPWGRRHFLLVKRETAGGTVKNRLLLTGSTVGADFHRHLPFYVIVYVVVDFLSRIQKIR